MPKNGNADTLVLLCVIEPPDNAYCNKNNFGPVSIGCQSCPYRLE